MKKQVFVGRCIENPEMPCICPLEPYCRATDPKLHPPLTEASHGAVMSRFVFGNLNEKYDAAIQIDDWRIEKDVTAIANGQDPSLCRRTGRRP